MVYSLHMIGILINSNIKVHIQFLVKIKSCSNMLTFVKQSKCRMCGSKKLKTFLDLGKIPLVDYFKTKHDLSKKEKFFPLNVCICKSCKLVQLGYLVPPEKMFNSNFAWQSSTTKYRTKIYFDMAKEICNRLKLQKNSFVVDIGSNDGVLLKGFKAKKMKILGVDPSSNVAKIAISNGIDTIIDFFGPSTASKILNKKGKAKVVTATNLFAHVHDYHSFMKGCSELLDTDGVFVFQSPYFKHLIRNNEYDTIYHEHASYISVTPLLPFFAKYAMEIFDIKEIDIDGGSIRCYIGRKGIRPVSTSVQKFVNYEKKSGLHTITKLTKFSKEVKTQRKELLQILKKLKKQDYRIVGVSAPAKGVVLLNFCGIDEKILDYVTEKAPLKIGKYVPGTKLKVFHDDILSKDFPDYALLLAWNFADEIIKNLKSFTKRNGKFIIPIPHPKIV